MSWSCYFCYGNRKVRQLLFLIMSRSDDCISSYWWENEFIMWQAWLTHEKEYGRVNEIWAFVESNPLDIKEKKCTSYKEREFRLCQRWKNRNQKETQKASLRSLSGLPWAHHLTLFTEVTQGTQKNGTGSSLQTKEKYIPWGDMGTG